MSKTTVTESHLTTLEIPIKFTKPLTTEMYAKPKEQAMYVLIIQYVVLCFIPASHSYCFELFQANYWNKLFNY